MSSAIAAVCLPIIWRLEERPVLMGPLQARNGHYVGGSGLSSPISCVIESSLMPFYAKLRMLNSGSK